MLCATLGLPISASNVITQPQFNNNTLITVIGADGNLYSKWQDATTAWYGWVNMGSGGGGFVSTPSLINQPQFNNNTVITAIGADGNLYFNWQNAATTEWSGWVNMGSGGGGFVSAPSMINQPQFNNNTVITAVGADGNLYFNWQNSTNVQWSGWVNM